MTFGCGGFRRAGQGLAAQNAEQTEDEFHGCAPGWLIDLHIVGEDLVPVHGQPRFFLFCALAPFEKSVSGMALATGSGLAATPAASALPLTCHLTVISAADA